MPIGHTRNFLFEARTPSAYVCTLPRTVTARQKAVKSQLMCGDVWRWRKGLPPLQCY